MNSKKRLSLAVIFLILIAAGCGRGSLVYHVREDVDFSYFKKVAVMPMENLTNERTAGDVVRNVVISELLASGLVDVAVPGDVVAALSDLEIKNGHGATLNEKQIKAIGKALNVEGLIIGAVEQYGETRSGNFSAPEVTITLMMVDAGSGNIVWSITRSRGGAGFMSRHFGAKADTMSETVLAVVRESIRTLSR